MKTNFQLESMSNKIRETHKQTWQHTAQTGDMHIYTISVYLNKKERGN